MDEACCLVQAPRGEAAFVSYTSDGTPPIIQPAQRRAGIPPLSPAALFSYVELRGGGSRDVPNIKADLRI